MELEKAISELKHYIQEVEKGGSMSNFHLTGQGAVASLEEKLRNHYGYKYCLVTCSATNTLTAIAYILDLHKGEVITSPFNFGSSIGWSKLLNGNIVFADTESMSLNISPESAADKITKKTTAIWAVDFGGYPHDMFAIRKLCNENDLYYVADAAQSFGARIDGEPASCLADILVTSFTTGKTLFAGEGGAVLTNNRQVYEKLLAFIHPYRQKLEIGLNDYTEEVPFNLRMNPLGVILANTSYDSSFEKLHFRQKQYSKLSDFLIDQCNDIIQLSLSENQPAIPSFYYCVGFSKNNDKQKVLNTVNKRMVEHYLNFKATDKLPFSLLYERKGLCDNASKNFGKVILFNYNSSFSARKDFHSSKADLIVSSDGP